MILAIVGTRTYDDYEQMSDFLYSHISLDIIDKIISGGASGADRLADYYSQAYDIPFEEILPDWNAYGKSAGPIRNKLIVDECTHLIAFWDGKSKGTLNSINLAKEAGKLWGIYYYKENRLELFDVKT